MLGFRVTAFVVNHSGESADPTLLADSDNWPKEGIEARELFFELRDLVVERMSLPKDVPVPDNTELTSEEDRLYERVEKYMFDNLPKQERISWPTEEA